MCEALWEQNRVAFHGSKRMCLKCFRHFSVRKISLLLAGTEPLQVWKQPGFLLCTEGLSRDFSLLLFPFLQV